MSPIAQLLFHVLQLFNFLLIIWCLLSWFPGVQWHKQPFKGLDMVIRPVIEPFRKIVPPIGNIDFSPIVAIVCINWVLSFLVRHL